MRVRRRRRHAGSGRCSGNRDVGARRSERTCRGIVPHRHPAGRPGPAVPQAAQRRRYAPDLSGSRCAPCRRKHPA